LITVSTIIRKGNGNDQWNDSSSDCTFCGSFVPILVAVVVVVVADCFVSNNIAKRFTFALCAQQQVYII